MRRWGGGPVASECKNIVKAPKEGGGSAELHLDGEKEEGRFDETEPPGFKGTAR